MKQEIWPRTNLRPMMSPNDDEDNNDENHSFLIRFLLVVVVIVVVVIVICSWVKSNRAALFVLSASTCHRSSLYSLHLPYFKSQ